MLSHQHKTSCYWSWKLLLYSCSWMASIYLEEWSKLWHVWVVIILKNTIRRSQLDVSRASFDTGFKNSSSRWVLDEREKKFSSSFNLARMQNVPCHLFFLYSLILQIPNRLKVMNKRNFSKKSSPLSSFLTHTQLMGAGI